MRLQHQTNGRVRHRFGLWIIALAAIGLPGFADEPVDVEPIDLAADSIRVWEDADGARMVLLDGRAAVLQSGVEGVRADRAVVRMTTSAESTGTFRVEVFAEGRAQLTSEDRDRSNARLTLTTDQPLKYKPYDAHGLVALQSPPAPTPLLRRAFAAEPPPAAPTLPAPPPLAAKPPEDKAIAQVQFGEDAPIEIPALIEPEDSPPVPDVNPLPLSIDPPTDIMPLPDAEAPSARPDEEGAGAAEVLLPYSRRTFNIAPRDAPETFEIQQLPEAADGSLITIIRGGVNIVTNDRVNGKLDLSADNAVIWTTRDPDGKAPGPNGGEQDEKTRFEVYLEGNVVLRQDGQKVAGTGDESGMKADRVYVNLQSQRKVARNAEFLFYARDLIAPMRTIGDRIDFYVPQSIVGGKVVNGPARVISDHARVTGSRFPKPGYLFQSRSVELTQEEEPLTDPTTGQPIDDPRDPDGRKEQVWLIDARHNFYFLGPVPIFYWPRIQFESDLELQPRNIGYRYGNYFGHQVLLDFGAFKLLNLKKPVFIDDWNLDIDVLSERGVGLGTEIGWAGRDILSDVTDPYRRTRKGNLVDQPYFGYFSAWGIKDSGIDVLGSGPSIVTDGPPGSGKRGFQRIAVPSFETYRGRLFFRHMQSLLGEDAADDEDDRLQLELGYLSDRNFLEQYYKQVFDSGIDHSNSAYFIHQRQNRAFTVLVEGNANDFDTETQWLPRLQYYRLGDALLGDLFSYSQHSGISYANTHTANEVNNPNIFAFIPFDPVSNTFGPFRTGRAYTAHELEMPINLDVVRFVPYAQGQLVGWDNQLGGETIGRAWGALGAKANLMAWRAFPSVESELFNVHGLNHKVNFNADYRTAYSNEPLNIIGVQDDLDSNTYEFARRYFALTNYVGGVLPPQYDPRLLTLRRGISPISGTVDIQDSIQTLKLGIHQRLQTKRGPEGRRRIIDYMIFDVTSTYFPNADRDNFGKPFGQNMYNYEWFIGDRTSIYSSGWFEFWEVQGQPILISNPRHTNDPFGLNVINSGISISRPPRGNVTIGYSVINTGPIATSAVIASYSYWLSPKWYSTFSTYYDFGNAILLGSTFSVTRIGADFLMSVGLSVDPQRENFTFGFELVPRLSPNVRFGSAGGAGRFDTRFAPTE